jgi:hypothetical protein
MVFEVMGAGGKKVTFAADTRQFVQKWTDGVRQVAISCRAPVSVIQKYLGSPALQFSA